MKLFETSDITTHFGKWKEIYFLILGLSLISALFIGILTWQNEKKLQQQKIKEVIHSIENTKELIFSRISAYDFDAVSVICETILHNPEILSIYVSIKGYNESSEFPICNHNKKSNQKATESKQIQISSPKPLNMGGAQPIILVTILESSSKTLIVESIKTSLFIFFLVLALLAGFSFLFTIKFILPHLRGILKAMKHSKKAGSSYIPLKSHSFIGEFAQQFNETQAKLNQEHNEKLKAEQELREREHLLRTTLNSIGDAVLSTDPSGNIQLMNPGAEFLIGRKFEEVVYQPIDDVFGPSQLDSDVSHSSVDPSDINILHDLEQDGVIQRRKLITKDGRKHIISELTSKIIGADNSVLGYVIVLRDITKDQEIQERLHQSEKMQAIGQLASGIAHDFNNVLSGISSAAELIELRMSDRLDERSKHCVELINRLTSKASTFVDKLLDVGRRRETSRKPTNIRELVNDTVDVLLQTVKRNIKVNVSDNLTKAWINGDASILQNAILNLCINATQSMQNGGELLITLSNKWLNEKETAGFMLTPQSGECILLSVKDTGDGIPENQINHIFDPFYTTRSMDGGTGLGLTAVYGAMESHSSGISIQSEVGVGTTITLYIPCIDTVKKAEKGDNKFDSGDKKTILFVDDEENIRTLISLLIEQIGHDVIGVSNGNEAIDIYNKKRSIIDVVILDLNMPGLNGAETASAIWAINPQCKIFISTGHAEHEVLKECDASKLSGILKKPYSIKNLSNAIQDITD